MKPKYVKIVYITVFCTGLFSLVYQTIWQRYLTFLVGADALSSTLILTVFLSALSLGYYLAGRFSIYISGKELIYYGVIEFIIGFWALLFPWLFDFSFNLVASGVVVNFNGDVILTVFLTAIPTIFMGFTLPFLTQGLSQNFQSSSKTHAHIYAINTLGACFGALITGFFLIDFIGLAPSMYLIAVLNMSLGVLMVYLFYTNSKQPNVENYSKHKSIEYPNKKVNTWALLFVVACSGYLLIAIESYFIRFFSIVTDGSIYAYPTVVTAFIAAIGIGAWLASTIIHHSHKVYPYIPLSVFFLWVLIYFSLPQWPFVDLQIKQWLFSWLGNYYFLPLMRFLVLFIIIGLPVMVSSMLLPFSFHMYKKRNIQLAETTGTLYAIATLATIIGGFLGGYYFFNYLDYQSIFYSYFIVMVLMALVAFMVTKTAMKNYLIATFVLLIPIVVLIAVPVKNLNDNLALSFYFQVPNATQSFPKDSENARKWLWSWFGYDEIISSSIRAEGRVDVFQHSEGENKVRMIAINGRSNSSTDGTDYQGNTLLSLFPYIMTESPKRVLVVGLGTGVTAGAIAAQKLVTKVDVCEINAAVIEQLPLFDFATFNASTNPKINIIQSDVIKYLLRSKDEYDIIVSIPSNFWTAGIENLMTTDFYTLAESRLATGGTFIQWIPDYDFSENGLLTLIKSFTTSFNQTSLWRLTPDDLVLMHNKADSSKRSWVNDRINDNDLLKVMDAIDYSNPSQLKRAEIAKDDLLRKMVENVEIHNINEPRLGRFALDALYHPEEKYSAESAVFNALKQ